MPEICSPNTLPIGRRNPRILSGCRYDGLTPSSQAADAGIYAYVGKHLVGSEVQPGTWQSVGDKVQDCYWEISDASGDIIDNNFISVAPQFTINIPADAAGFTNTGCAFQRIGD